MKSRKEVQKEALQSVINNNFKGCLVLSPGTGKSKVAIDCIKHGDFRNILITSPRTNLKDNWRSELEKWGFDYQGDDLWCDFKPKETQFYNIALENIQTCYRWDLKQLKQFDFVIVDEVHTIGQEYFALIQNCKTLNIKCLGLTGTPNKSDLWKKEVLYKILPIIYEYYNAEEDGITNSIKYWVYEYELTDAYKVITGTKDKKWPVGELKQYTYLSEKYEEAKNKMFELGASDYFDTSMLWMKGKAKSYEGLSIQSIFEGDYVEIDATKEQKEWGRKFFFAIRNRKEFLWNLTSSKFIALNIKNKILGNTKNKWIDYAEWKFLKTGEIIPVNKVLLFSELTSQAEKLSSYSIHSNNGKNAKEAETINKELLKKFNIGELRELSSCLSLILGLNITGTTHAIVESFSSSNTNFIQKSKRLARLNKNEVANVVIIVPKNTQAETWKAEMMKDIEYTTITDLNDLKI